MRLLPLILTSSLVLIGCSSGAGMQATPPASISQAAIREAPTDGAADGAVEAAAGLAPTSESSGQAEIPTGGGGRYLLI